MAEFFATPFGIAIIIVAQCLAVVGFVMISLLFLVYGDRKIWAAVQMRQLSRPAQKKPTKATG